MDGVNGPIMNICNAWIMNTTGASILSKTRIPKFAFLLTCTHICTGRKPDHQYDDHFADHSVHHRVSGTHKSSPCRSPLKCLLGVCIDSRVAHPIAHKCNSYVLEIHRYSALRESDCTYAALVTAAMFSGVGGGAFASSMSNISFFFPKKDQGLALGLNGGLGASPW